MVKPKIAIVNTSSQLAICFSHLDEIARRARRAIELAGGVGFEVRTAAPSDFITSAGHRGGYILSARDLITNDIEVQVEGAQLDGMHLPRVLRQDGAGPADGRRQAEHPHDHRRVRLPGRAATTRAGTATSKTCSSPPATSRTAG